MKYLLLVFILLMLQSCISSRCFDYGYFDFSQNERAKTIKYNDFNIEDGWKGVSKFPLKYTFDKERYKIYTEMILDKGFPSVIVNIEPREIEKFSLEVNLEVNTCLHIKKSNSSFEMWWDTESKSCKNRYNILLTVQNEIGKQIDSFNIEVLLQKNGKTCMLDAI